MSEQERDAALKAWRVVKSWLDDGRGRGRGRDRVNLDAQYASIEAALTREMEIPALIAAAYRDAADAIDFGDEAQESWPASVILDRMPMDARAALDAMLEEAASEAGWREIMAKHTAAEVNEKLKERMKPWIDQGIQEGLATMTAARDTWRKYAEAVSEGAGITDARAALKALGELPESE